VRVIFRDGFAVLAVYGVKIVCSLELLSAKTL
jgi:hypothetical protein